MRLSISNIAWQADEDATVANMLAKYDINAIDVAPAKYFSDVAKATSQQISEVRLYWLDRGINIVGMQSLLFGTQGLNLFDTPTVRQQMLTHLAHVCRIANGLGARFLVFGSPKNRDRGDLTDHQTKDIASEFFNRLGDIAADHGSVICLEPNPTMYGANFLTDTTSTAAFVRDLDHKSVRMQLDIGALTINGENPLEMLADHSDLVAHIHASEPDLKELGSCETSHAPIAEAVRNFCSDHIVTIEMREHEVNPMDSVDRALSFARHWYG